MDGNARPGSESKDGGVFLDIDPSQLTQYVRRALLLSYLICYESLRRCATRGEAWTHFVQRSPGPPRCASYALKIGHHLLEKSTESDVIQYSPCETRLKENTGADNKFEFDAPKKEKIRERSKDRRGARTHTLT